MNLMQKLNSVMKKVGYVQKDKTIGKENYAYGVATYDQVLAVVREHLVDAGVVVVTRQTSPGKMVPTGTFYGAKGNSNGIEALRYEAMYEVEFINTDDPADKLTVPVESHAIDQGDKAPGKCQTYATKAAIKKVLLLETGDEEESRAAVHAPANDSSATQPAQKPAARADAKPAEKKGAGKPASEGQIAFIGKKLAAAGKTEADLLKHLVREAIAGLTEDEANEALAWIRGKAA